MNSPICRHFAPILISCLALAACSSQPTLTASTPADAKAGRAELMASFVPTARGYQRLPIAAADYRDADAQVSGGADPRWNPQKNAHIRVAQRRAKGPLGSHRELARLAYLYALRGDYEATAQALSRAKTEYPDAVGVYWSEGWIRMNLRDYAGALAAWQRAEELHGGQPFWVPYSKAVALYGAGDQEAALAWWQLTVRSHAPRLNSAAAAQDYFSHWRPAERRLLKRLLAVAYPGPQLGRVSAQPVNEGS